MVVGLDLYSKEVSMTKRDKIFAIYILMWLATLFGALIYKGSAHKANDLAFMINFCFAAVGLLMLAIRR